MLVSSQKLPQSWKDLGLAAAAIMMITDTQEVSIVFTSKERAVPKEDTVTTVGKNTSLKNDIVANKNKEIIKEESVVTTSKSTRTEKVNVDTIRKHISGLKEMSSASKDIYLKVGKEEGAVATSKTIPTKDFSDGVVAPGKGGSEVHQQKLDQLYYAPTIIFHQMSNKLVKIWISIAPNIHISPNTHMMAPII